MNKLTRRTFLKSTALVSAAASFPALRSWGQTPSASDEIRVAVVGFHGRGADHIKGFSGIKGVKLTGLCDVDKDVLARGAKKLEEQGAKVETYVDIRKLLESKNVDVISIATPNHWHALGAIWAIQAGKDVYLEKPVSHNVWEGRKIVEAARKYNKVVQTGTQSRSSNAIKEAIDFVNAGNLGKLNIVRGLCYKPRGSIGKTQGAQKVPDSIDYDLWCGPAPLDPPRRNNTKFGPVHYDWHWFWAYGCGDLGNQGIHQMDIARWFLGVNELSPRVFSFGGRLGYVDDAETPNTQVVFHDYAKAPLIFEVRGLPQKTGAKNMDQYKGGSVAVVVECENGHVLVPNYVSAIAKDKSGAEIKSWKGGGDGSHYQNFIDVVRSRKVADLKSDILEGHLSSALCHTGNISYRLGRKASPEQIKDAIKSEKGALESFERMVAHLEANDVDLAKTPVTLGPMLTMDPKSETFTGGPAAANAMLTRPYRKPYVVPEQV